MTNRVSQSVSVIAARARDQRAFSASALFSERLRGARSVKTDIIASLNVHANIEEITALELSCLILFLIWFHQTTAQYNYKLVFLCRLASWKGELVILKGTCFSHYFIFILLTDNINSQIYKVKQFYWEFGCIKIQYEHRETIRQNRTVIFFFTLLCHLADAFIQN